MKNLAAAFVKAQAAFPVLPKDGKSNFGAHATLHTIMEKVLPVLTENGLALIQPPTTIEGQPALRTILLHESGESIEDTMLLILDKNNSQGQGSALTYARRYAALSFLGVVADEDDDGAAASKVAPAKQQPQQSTAAAAAAPNDRLASQAQKNRLFAIISEVAGLRGVDPEQVRSALKGALNIESMANLTVGDAARADVLLAEWRQKVEAAA